MGILGLSLALPSIQGASPGAQPSSSSDGDPTAKSPVLPEVSADQSVDGDSACGPGITGTWTGTVSETDTEALTLFLTQSSSNVTGSYETEAGDNPECGPVNEGRVSGSVAGNLYSLRLDFPEKDNDTCETLCVSTVVASLTINENEMGGPGSSSNCLDPGFRDQLQFSMTRDCPSPQPVPDGDPILSTSSQGFVFFAQGDVVQQSPLEIVNTGGQQLDWRVATQTLSGASWLSASPESGSTTATRGSSFVGVRMDPSGLAQGDHYGSVTVSSDSNSASQTVTVVTRVSPEDAFLPAQADPEGFLFVHAPPLGAPSEIVVFTNPGTRPLQLEVEPLFGDGLPAWFRFEALTENVLAPGDSVALEIEVASDFTPAVRNGELRVTSRPADGGGEPAVTQRLAARLLVPLGEDGAALAGPARRQLGCTPTQLVLVLTRPSLDFTVVAGWPIAMEAEIFNDCGAPLTSGSVTAEFSNGDPLLALEPLRDGRWVATWAPVREAADTSLTLRAASLEQPNIEGTLEIAGSIPETAATPILGAPPVSAVSFARDQPISLGAFTALFGVQLAGARSEAESLPLPHSLEETSVFIGGSPMPLLFASSGQVNGIVPFDLASGRRHSLLVQRGVTLSAPPTM